VSTDQRKPTLLRTQQSPRSPSKREGTSDLMQTVRTGTHRPPLAFLGVLLMLSLAVSACGQGSSAATHHMAMSTAMPTGMMGQPAYAKDMKIAIVSPASGVMVTSNALTVSVAATGYTLSCDYAGKADRQGIGHYHVLLDKALVNMFCTPTATISMQNVSRGMHTLTVVPALNDHSEVEENAKCIMFDYEPANPLPTLTDVTFAGKPSITILAPKNGDIVSGAFDIVVQVTNYNLSCNLMGKPDVAGYGHWHANLDSMSGPMMGMGSMLGMSCTNVFHATTAGLKAGQTHTIIALLTDDGHAPLNPAVDSQVTVKIGG
jgi:hypothetical protein